MRIFAFLMSLLVFSLSSSVVWAGQDFIGLEEAQVQTEYTKVQPVLLPTLDHVEGLLALLSLSATVEVLDQTISSLGLTSIQSQNNVLELTDLPPPSSL